MLQYAFKEWAVICQALAEGRQALILRKGGIAEAGGSFRVQHTRFWLFATYLHEHKEGIRAEAVPLLEQVEKDKPPAGQLRFSHFAEVAGIYHVHDLAPAMLLAHLHFWSDATVAKRFHYKQPGLYVLPVRVYRAAQVHSLPDSEYYQGCRSWVELERALPTDGATPVLDDQAFRSLLESLDLLLKPTALA
jgi:hypothetical protein